MVGLADESCPRGCGLVQHTNVTLTFRFVSPAANYRAERPTPGIDPWRRRNMEFYMRKIIVSSFVTLDGVMRAPGGLEEGFKYGGWSAPYFDEVVDSVLEKQKEKPADLLLGRKTFEIFASYWPEHADIWPGINDVTKYVMSNTMEKSDWKNSVFLKAWQILKSSKIQTVLTFKFPAVVSSFSCYLRMI